MNIQNIQFTSKVVSLGNTPKNKQQSQSVIEKKAELPKFAYRDFNINFGERLNRTPENFYAQRFNQDNMPQKMKTYLYSDFDKNSKLAPALIMKLTYEDINQIDSLEFIRRLFAEEEPLFANLTDTPNRNVRKGVVADVEAMKDEFASVPLLKDGSSDLGIYLLRKIYFDGKTLDEIKKDFKTDLSPEYEGLISTDLQYDDVYAYGIKFPRTPYWKSFIATREDFPYVYRPRKTSGSASGEHRERTLSDITSGNYMQPKQKQKFKVRDNNEGRRYGDAILKGHGNSQATEKNLRNKGIYDSEKLNFVSRYLSEIMSIALEKTHASEEMHNFFENYDNLTKKQQEKLEVYWQVNPMMKELQSLAITDTIKLFFELYGADGNNPEFQELLEYARSIKPNREEQVRQHNLIQLEYDKLAEELAQQDAVAAQQAASEAVPPKKELTEEEIQSKLKEEALKNGAEIFTITNKDGQKISFVSNVNEEFEKYMRKRFALVPTPVLNKFIRFCIKSEFSTPEYRKCLAFQSYLPSEMLEELGIDKQRCDIVATKLNSEFYQRNKNMMGAAQQAIAEMLINKTSVENLRLLRMIASYQQMYAANNLGISEWTPEEMSIVNKKFQEYNTPIKNRQEVNKICSMIPELISSINPDSPQWLSIGELDDIDALIAANLRRYPDLKKDLYKAMKSKGFIESYDGTPRILLKEDVSDSVKIAKARLLFRDFIVRQPETAAQFLVVNKDNIDKYVSDGSTKLSLLKQHQVLNQKLFGLSK